MPWVSESVMIAYRRNHEEVVRRLERIENAAAWSHANTERILKELLNMKPEIERLTAAIGPLVAGVNALLTEAQSDRQAIVDLTAKVAAGDELTADEKQALTDASTNVEGLIAKLGTAVTPVQPAVDAANVAAAGAPDPAAAGPGATQTATQAEINKPLVHPATPGAGPVGDVPGPSV